MALQLSVHSCKPSTLSPHSFEVLQRIASAVLHKLSQYMWFDAAAGAAMGADMVVGLQSLFDSRTYLKDLATVTAPISPEAAWGFISCP